MAFEFSIVRKQYEDFPYPVRNPADERTRLLKTNVDSIPAINHFVFGGEFDFSRPLRVLVAGGGTGDSLIYIAQQVADLGIPAEITYLDLSAESRRIAEARAEVRGLKGLHFRTGSLLDLEGESFDYINCTGVLHHLKTPLEGVAALERNLSPRGGLGLMLYGNLGRTGVYPVQAMLRTLAPDTLASAERIRIARKLLAGLPENHWLKRNPAFTPEEWREDANLYDLLLHSQDRAYSVDEAAQLLADVGLRISSFMPPAIYDPATHLKDPELLERISGLDVVERAAFAERLAAMNKLVFYAVKADNPVELPDPTDLDFIPILSDFPPLASSDYNSGAVPLNGPYFYGTAQLNPQTLALLRLVDGRRRLRDICRELGIDAKDFERLLGTFLLWLRDLTYLQLSKTPWPPE